MLALWQGSFVWVICESLHRESLFQGSTFSHIVQINFYTYIFSCSHFSLKKNIYLNTFLNLFLYSSLKKEYLNVVIWEIKKYYNRLYCFLDRLQKFKNENWVNVCFLMIKLNFLKEGEIDRKQNMDIKLVYNNFYFSNTHICFYVHETNFTHQLLLIHHTHTNSNH